MLSDYIEHVNIILYIITRYAVQKISSMGRHNSTAESLPPYLCTYTSSYLHVVGSVHLSEHPYFCASVCLNVYMYIAIRCARNAQDR